ncbi:MAG: hypothetical protein LBC18_05375 [Opitutaceae bacterium]|nr:hypothetical protein [Opitutaceae bacterium]
MDDFYNGQPLDIALARYQPELAAGAKLTVSILPLRKDTPVYMADSALPRFGKKAAVADLTRVELVPRHTHTLVVKDADDTDDDDDAPAPAVAAGPAASPRPRPRYRRRPSRRRAWRRAP